MNATLLTMLLVSQAPATDDYTSAPPIRDLSKFPNSAVALEQVLRHEQHIEWARWMGKQPVLDARFDNNYWAGIELELQNRMDCWIMLAGAHQVGHIRRWWGIPPRHYLEQLRDRLGRYDYSQATMPPMLPPSGPIAPSVNGVKRQQFQ